jgi:heptosyltransferase-2
VPATITSPNILAVRFSSIGDILLITPLLRAIRHAYPSARVTVVTKRDYLPLLSHNPHISRVIGLAPGRSLTSLATELRGDQYTDLLDLHDNLRSRVLRVLVPGRWRSYPKHRLARAFLVQAKRNRYRDRRPVPERYFSSVKHLHIVPDGAPPEFFIGPEAAEEVTGWLETVGIRGSSFVAVAPGAAHSTKRWPAAHWRVLLERIERDRHRIVIVGGPADTGIGAELAAVLPGGIANAAGKFGLQGTGAILQRARALVSGDTGVMHMATGVGTPVVALFGPTVEAFGFFPYTSRARVVELALGCRPCSTQGGPRCPLGHHRCMVEIQADSVYRALRDLLS